MGKQVDVLSTSGQVSGTVELPDALFSARVSAYAVHRAVVAYETNQRQGTASTKTRSEINRSSKKHHRQKGTGWARRGSLRSPVVKGGGVAFGPKPRHYEIRLPNSLKRLAFRSALTLKGEGDQVKVVEDFSFEQPSTKSLQQVLTACGLAGRKVLFITPDNRPLLVKSCRNLPTVEIAPVGGMCAYDVIAADTVLFTRQALGRLAETHVGDANAA